MAVTKIWPIRTSIAAPINYVVNTDKTASHDPVLDSMSEESIQALEDVIEYTANEKKTEMKYYVSTLNCNKRYARDEFLTVKKRFGKEGGIVAYHAYQSFAEGEVNPNQAHHIGIELAKELWGDRFQVVVANLKRYDEVNKLYTKLYESFAMEIIPEDKFKMLSEAYEKEQMKLQKEIRTYEEELVSTKDAVDDIERFYELVDKFTSFEELTTQMLNEFVDKIIVHKAEKIDKRRVQEVEIYLNYIGKIDFLEPEEIDPEQEAIDKYWRDKYWRTKEYELNRRKKETAESNKVIEAKEKAERERIIEELNAEIEALGIENMPVIPERLMPNSQNV